MANDTIKKNGNIEVADGVIIAFVEKIVTETKGIAISKKKKSIKVTTYDGGKKIDCFLEVNYGVIIPEIVNNLQSKVKKTIKLMTGVDITEFNVIIDSLNIDTLLEK
ncbi:MAG: Asp23/Gls24 family envelope stress response protein [Clostridiales bacterium]|nr:Asp23/Gls24 family envelope stress response protein [Clostridiales bacterium]